MKCKIIMKQVIVVLLVAMIFLTGGCERYYDEVKQQESVDIHSSSEQAGPSEDAAQFGTEGEEKAGNADTYSRIPDAPDVSTVTDPRMQDTSATTDPETLQYVIKLAGEAKEHMVFEYADFTAEELIAEAAAVYQMAHDGGYVYGDSKTTPPCEDGFISCDRLIARTLWNLGLTDQIEKGMNVGVEVQYLTTHGFELVTDQSKLTAGDIVMQDNGVSGRPNWKWHTFLLVSYDPDTTMCEKYDCGHFTVDGVDRVSAEQPFVCPLADYGDQRRFVCGFHLREKPPETDKSDIGDNNKNYS